MNCPLGQEQCTVSSFTTLDGAVVLFMPDDLGSDSYLQHPDSETCQNEDNGNTEQCVFIFAMSLTLNGQNPKESFLLMSEIKNISRCCRYSSIGVEAFENISTSQSSTTFSLFYKNGSKVKTF